MEPGRRGPSHEVRHYFQASEWERFSNVGFNSDSDHLRSTRRDRAALRPRSATNLRCADLSRDKGKLKFFDERVRVRVREREREEWSKLAESLRERRLSFSETVSAWCRFLRSIFTISTSRAEPSTYRYYFVFLLVFLADPRRFSHRVPSGKVRLALFLRIVTNIKFLFSWHWIHSDINPLPYDFLFNFKE